MSPRETYEKEATSAKHPTTSETMRAVSSRLRGFMPFARSAGCLRATGVAMAARRTAPRKMPVTDRNGSARCVSYGVVDVHWARNMMSTPVMNARPMPGTTPSMIVHSAMGMRKGTKFRSFVPSSPDVPTPTVMMPNCE